LLKINMLQLGLVNLYKLIQAYLDTNPRLGEVYSIQYYMIK
jgi:hypothetical protein